MEENISETKQNNIKTGPIIIIVLLLIAWLGFTFVNKKSSDSKEQTTALSNESTSIQPSGDISQDNTGEPVSAVREFTVNGDNFKFDLKTITVNKGDKVKINFVNKEGKHDFVLDEFNIATKVLNAESSESVEFVADKVGTFEYYCSVGEHRAMGMVGNLTVK